MRVDEVKLLHGARHVEHTRLIEHRKGMMGNRGRRQQRHAEARKAENCPGHCPLHDMRYPTIPRTPPLITPSSKMRCRWANPEACDILTHHLLVGQRTTKP